RVPSPPSLKTRSSPLAPGECAAHCEKNLMPANELLLGTPSLNAAVPAASVVLPRMTAMFVSRVQDGALTIARLTFALAVPIARSAGLLAGALVRSTLNEELILGRAVFESLGTGPEPAQITR